METSPIVDYFYFYGFYSKIKLSKNPLNNVVCVIKNYQLQQIKMETSPIMDFFCFWTFLFQLASLGLVIQSYKCSTWSCFALSPGFSSFIDFCCLLDNIGVLGISFEFSFFISAFLQNMLDEDVHHVNVFLKLGVVQVSFGIRSLYFA